MSGVCFPPLMTGVASRLADPIICYAVAQLPKVDVAQLQRFRQQLRLHQSVRVAPRSAEIVAIAQGQFFRICCNQGSQVGDLNVWNAHNLQEKFYSGKTRQLHATHLSSYDRLWSCHPYLRPLATISYDSLAWYGYDADGAGVHDVIGTRCDPYTNRLLTGADYHYCCHSNLCRALARYLQQSIGQVEALVHDVMNVFMCTGFQQQTHQYFMKASPARAGDFIEFFADQDLLIGLSACPGGDCGKDHSSDVASCYPLDIEVYDCLAEDLKQWSFADVSAYRHAD